MTESLLAAVLALAGLLPPAAPTTPAADPASDAAPRKTVILGFDGMDHALTRRFLDQGLLPNFARLAQRGTFQPLETSNPAQSPVSWAVINTGTNPGKTGVAGFVSRHIVGPAVLPHPMLGDPIRVPADPHVTFPMAMHDRLTFVALFGGGAFLGGMVLLRTALRQGRIPSLLIALVMGGGAGAWAHHHASGLPPDGKLPYVVNPMQGTNFWDYLDPAGVRLRGIQIASTYPPDEEGPNTELLSGLGLPDVGGSNGTFYVYTNDPWAFEKGTDAGGQIVKIYDDEPGVFKTVVTGPRNWYVQSRFDHEREVLRGERDAAGLSSAEVAAIDARLSQVEAEERRWKNRGDKASVPLVLRADTDAGTVDVELGGHSETVALGGWSGYVPVSFELGGAYAVHGLVRFHVIACSAEEVRVFTPPICIDPRRPPEWLPICSPPDFSARLAERIGQPFETLGWGCMANPLKDIEDTHFSVQSFIDDLEENCSWRGRILQASLEDADDWDVYYQVWGDTDRMAHMVYREFDPGHPLHDAAYAAQPVEMFDRTFPLSDAIQHIYEEADRLVGLVLDAMDGGRLGDDPLLMVISDHGFTSWRHSINLNNALAEKGWLALTGGVTVADYRQGGGATDLLRYVDWNRTKAYSMGLGKVFVNLAGREPNGIVAPEDYDEVLEAIRADLLDLRDADGARVVTSVMRRDELFNGPWWKEGQITRREAGRDVPYKNDGFADLFMGYAPNHRVAGSNTMGGLASATITVNEGHWSGDHVSVDPSHVRGVLFTSAPLAGERSTGLADIAPTVLRRYGLDPAPPHTEMDGRAIEFAGD